MLATSRPSNFAARVTDSLAAHGLLLSEKARENSWLFWIVGMTLAALGFWDAFKSNLNMVATAAPGWFAAFSTRCSAAHGYISVFVIELVTLFDRLENFSKCGIRHQDF